MQPPVVTPMPTVHTPRSDRLVGWLCRAAGIALIAIPFLPLHAIYGDVLGTAGVVAPADWLLGFAIFGGAAWIFAVIGGERADRIAAGAFRALLGAPPRRVLAASALALLALLILTSHFVFVHRPRLVDEVVLLFQAKIFAAGLLTAPSPPGEAFFAVQHMIVDGNGWYAQYPPGHSLLLALGALVGEAWLVAVALSLGTFLLLWAFVREAYGPRTARLTAALAVLCPFFWVLGASFMNHVSELFFVTAFLYGFARWESDGRTRWLAVSGAALGAAFQSRPVTSIAVGAAFALPIALTVWRRRAWGALLAAACSFVALAAVYPAYNFLTTGDPLTTGYVKLWGKEHELGFHVTPWGEVHTPATGLRNELFDLALLGRFLFEWPIPALMPLGLFFAAGMGRGRWDRRLLAGLIAIPAAYFFYWHRDDFLGPRFLYPTVAFALPLTARAAVVGWRRLQGTRVARAWLLRPFGAGTFAAALLLLSAAYGIAVGIPMVFTIHARSWPSARIDVVARAREADLSGGIIMVATSWGSRLLAEMRAVGVGASLAQQAYQKVDHCELQELVDRAERDAWPRSRLQREIAHRIEAGEEVLSLPRLTGDPSIRLKRNSVLSRACLEEIAYDRLGFALYTPLLIDNEPQLDGRWIIARDMRSENATLFDAFPDRPVWLYRNGTFEPLRGVAASASR